MEDFDHLDDFEKAHKEFEKIRDVLSKDIDTCETALTETDNPFWRRSFVRASFAYIEALLHRMKVECFQAYKLGDVEYTREEVALILDESYLLNDKGEATVRTAFYNIEKTIRFVFIVYARAWGVSFKLDCSDIRWNNFRNAVAIRNRITHPKEFSDLGISDADMEIVKDAGSWFTENEIRLNLIINKYLRKEHERLKRELAQKEKRLGRANSENPKAV